MVESSPLFISSSKLIIGANSAANVLPDPVGALINTSFPEFIALNAKS